MSIELVTTPYGPAAAEALHGVVSAYKLDDPLAPVSIVVPTNFVGVSTRRMLAEGRYGPVTGSGTGIVGVTLLTLYRIAEMIGAPRLAAAGRRPVSTPVIAAAIRTVLSSEPGMFAGVAEHPTTEESLVRTHHELSDLDAAQLDLLARQSERADDVVRIHRATRANLATDWYDEHDLMDSAITVIAEGSAVLPDLGAIAIYLPQRSSNPQAALVRAVAERAPVTVIAGLTGVDRADATARATCERFGLDRDRNGPVEPHTIVTPAHGSRLLSASDADDEVRASVRIVVEGLRDGVPLERMAILYGSERPYARIVHEQLEAAGIAHNGAAVRTVAESLVGRTLLGALALPDHEFRRQDVLALLASAPVRGDDGRLVPVSAWERVSRRAGVVRGVSQWRRRLDQRIEDRTQELAAERTRTDREPRVRHIEREIDDATGLRDFVEHLAAQLDPRQLPPSWEDKAAWAHGLLQRLLGDERHRERWPDHEVHAAERVEQALDRLAGLDDVEPAPSLAVFRRTLEMELDSGLGRVGRFGEGLLMGRVPMGLGVEFDRVVVLGLAEGTFPARHREDSLLPDAERDVLGGELPLRGARPDDDHRALLALLASTTGDSVLCFPRGDLRRSTQRMPSRFWLDTLQALHGGDRLYADDLESLEPADSPWLTQIESYVGGLSRMAFPATVQDYDLRVLLENHHGGGRVDAHPLATDDPVLASGLRLVRARQSRAFTRFDGNLAGHDVPAPSNSDVIVSPTRLETWVKCPHRYFMESVLGLAEPDTPEEQLEITALDLGNVVHETLDRFVREVLEDVENRPGSGQKWTKKHRARLQEIGELVCDEFEERGLTGRAVLWRRKRRTILRDLDTLLMKDDDRRLESELAPVASELRFGFPDEPPALEISLGDGRTLRFRGSADRVDLGADGDLVVIDYKTGSDYAFGGISGGDDPMVHGTKLQLPVYGLAARREFGTDVTSVSAAYWFVTTKRKFRWIGYELTNDILDSFRETLATITDGIEAGAFPAHPERPGGWKGFIECPWCDPDGLEGRDRYREWERKLLAPELRGYVELAAPDELGEALARRKKGAGDDG